MSIQLIQQAICYMEEHIYEKINYAEVAKSVHMSSYNFHRTFSFIAGMTANGYTIWDTRPADYVVFKCFGPDSDCLGETWSKFFKEFSPQTGYVQTDDTDYEIYFENGEKDLFCELWIPVRKE